MWSYRESEVVCAWRKVFLQIPDALLLRFSENEVIVFCQEQEVALAMQQALLLLSLNELFRRAWGEMGMAFGEAVILGKNKVFCL